MSENEKKENLANARQKLKKFRNQQPNNSQINGTDLHSPNGAPIESPINSNIPPVYSNFNIPRELFDNDQQSISNGTHQSLSKLEDQRRLNSGNSTSGRSSQNSIDLEQKLRRDIEHLQEQLEVHVQTIGVLVAEKTDLSAKLSQSFKQLERKQSEMDELYGRLKASREHVQELEKQIQNSTSSVQKREMAAKESDKENDRLKIENIRQSQLIEDLKQNINQLKEKLQNEQLQNESQPKNDTATIEQTIQLKNNQIEELQSSITRLRTDNDQYQEHSTNMHHHIQELNQQIKQLNEKNQILENDYDTIKKAYAMKYSQENSTFDYDNLQQQNQLFQSAINQWSNRYEELKLKLEQMTLTLTEKDQLINELQTNVNNSKDKNQTVEQEIQTQEYNSSEQLSQTINENTQLKERIQELEHIIQQLQTETETIGDYIRLYQQQREQLQKRYQEKDDCIKQLTQDKLDLQNKLSDFENFLIGNINNHTQTNPSESNEQLEMTTNGSPGIEQTNLSTLPQLSDETKLRLVTLMKELEQRKISSKENDKIKLAFVDKNFHMCSTCSGRVQWV